jgi:hypothetical protein
MKTKNIFITLTWILISAFGISKFQFKGVNSQQGLLKYSCNSSLLFIISILF